jgi:hypothetical protein
VSIVGILIAILIWEARVWLTVLIRREKVSAG